MHGCIVLAACPIKKGDPVAPFLPKLIKGAIVNIKAMMLVKTCALFAALTLTACGGGGSGDSIAPTECSQQNISACGGSGTGTTGTSGSGTTTAAVALFTTAPSDITMTSAGSTTYTVGGGGAPYTATSGNTGVATTSLAGATLTINSIAAGTAPIAVVNSVGKSVTINVTVLAKGQTGIPPSIFPASINAGDCTTNIPFIFTGGTAPFTTFTSDNFGVPVSTPQPLGSDSYFTASIRNPLGPFPYIATVTVLDSQSRTAIANITIDYPRTCTTNALLQTNPASANAHVTEILTFQITGGVAPYTATSSDTAIATPVVNGTSLNVKAESTGTDPSKLTGTALITVKGSDNQQANIVFTVFPQQ